MEEICGRSWSIINHEASVQGLTPNRLSLGTLAMPQNLKRWRKKPSAVGTDRPTKAYTVRTMRAYNHIEIYTKEKGTVRSSSRMGATVPPFVRAWAHVAVGILGGRVQQNCLSVKTGHPPSVCLSVIKNGNAFKRSRRETGFPAALLVRIASARPAPCPGSASMTIRISPKLSRVPVASVGPGRGPCAPLLYRGS